MNSNAITWKSHPGVSAGDLLVMAVMAPFAALKAGDLRKILLALILLDLPLQWDVNLGYGEELSALGAKVGWNISITTMCLAVLYAQWVTALLLRAAPRPRLGPCWPLLLYFGFVVLSAAAATDLTLSLYELFLLGQMLLLHIYVVGTVRTRAEVVYIVALLLAGLVLEGLIMGLLVVTRENLVVGGFPVGVVSPSALAGTSFRVAGSMGSPNVVSGYLSLLLAVACGVLLTSLGRRYKVLASLAIGLGLMGLIYTFSRGGWIGFGVSLMVLCLAAWQGGWIPRRLAVGVVAVPLLLALAFLGPILSRLQSDDRGAAHSRIPLMEIAFDVGQDHPFAGVGPNNFVSVMRPYFTSVFSGEWVYTVHNKYLLVWAETGVGGLGAFLIFLLVTLRRGWRCWRRHDPLLSPLALGITAGITGQMAHMLVEVFNGRSQIQALWFAAALIAVVEWMNRSTGARPPQRPRA